MPETVSVLQCSACSVRQDAPLSSFHIPSYRLPFFSFSPLPLDALAQNSPLRSLFSSISLFLFELRIGGSAPAVPGVLLCKGGVNHLVHHLVLSSPCLPMYSPTQPLGKTTHKNYQLLGNGRERLFQQLFLAPSLQGTSLEFAVLADSVPFNSSPSPKCCNRFHCSL